MDRGQLRIVWTQETTADGPDGPFRSALVETLVAQMRQQGVAGVVIHDDQRLVQLIEGPADAVEQLFAAAQDSPWRDDPQVLERRPLALSALAPTCRVSHAATSAESAWLRSRLDAGPGELSERIVDWAVGIALSAQGRDEVPRRLLI